MLQFAVRTACIDLKSVRLSAVYVKALAITICLRYPQPVRYLFRPLPKRCARGWIPRAASPTLLQGMTRRSMSPHPHFPFHEGKRQR